MQRTDTFWAAAQGGELARQVHLKVERYFLALQSQGLLARYRQQYAAYYMRDGIRDTSTLYLGTRKSPAVEIAVPEARALLRQQLAFAVSEPVSFQVVSTVGEQSSVMSSELAEKAVNYKMDQHVRPYVPVFAEIATLYGTAATHMRWDRASGDEIQEPVVQVDPLTGQPGPVIEQGPQGPRVATQPAKSGAPYVDVLDPTMFAIDPRIGERAGWAVAFERTNLYVLAGRYPDRAEQILNLQCHDRYDQHRIRPELQYALGANERDVVALHWYYADRPELPGGRYALIVDDEVIDYQERCPLPNGRLPVRWVTTAPVTDSALSFCDGFGLLPIEQALNKILSSELSNYAYYGAQTRWREEGTRIVPGEERSGGVREITGPRGSTPPKMLEIQPMPPGAEGLKRSLLEALPRISGFGDVSRGQIDKTTSGVHANVFEAITARNLSLPQAVLTQHQEHLANDMLELMRAFGNQSFFVEFGGKAGGTVARELSFADLGGIRRIVAKAVPDALRGPNARVSLVEQVSKFEDPRERAKAIAFVTRGDDEFGKNDSRKLNLVAVENERLRSGDVPVTAAITQDHAGHIQDHAADLDGYLTEESPDPAVIERYAAHISEHAELAEAENPTVALALGHGMPPIMPGNAAFEYHARMAEAQAMLAPPPMAAPQDAQPQPQQSEAPQ